ncbi:MAG: class I SAM-dependent methyltransferase [Pseudomonadales bacterium]
MSESHVYGDMAALYDAAFTWDNSAEVDFIERELGPGRRRVLEPGCGSGRLLVPMAARGFEMLGIDSSAEMLALTEAKLTRQSLRAELIESDMSEFSLERPVDAAVCPIQTFGHLHGATQVMRHLICMSRSLASNGVYLVQMGLWRLDGFTPTPPGEHNRWEFEFEGETVQITWCGVEWNPRARVETQRSGFVWLSGPDAGRTVYDDHLMRVWDWDGWSTLVRLAGFRQVAAFDGDAEGYPELSPGDGLDGRELVWHVLVKG